MQDIQHKLEGSPTLCHYICVSVHDGWYDADNPQLHDPTHDLATAATMTLWSKRIVQGQVAAIIAKPPSDTWKPNDTNRTTQHLWGTPYQTSHHHRSTRRSNRHYQYTITLLHLAKHTRTPALLLTPTPRWQQQQPHIWRADQLLQLKDAHNTVDFDLCSFGHHCKASTRLLALNWTNLVDIIRQRPNRSKCTCTSHHFDPLHHDLTTGTFQLPPDLSDLIAATLSIEPRESSDLMVDNTDYTAYLPLDPYYMDHLP